LQQTFEDAQAQIKIQIMKFSSIKHLLQFYIPVTLTLFMLVTIERTVLTDGGYDKLFGLPLPYVSSSYAFSFHYDVYILAMFFNLLFYFALTIAFFKILEKSRLNLKTNWAFIAIGTIVSLFWITIFALMTQDSSFKIKTNTEYKTTSKKLTFGVRP